MPHSTQVLLEHRRPACLSWFELGLETEDLATPRVLVTVSSDLAKEAGRRRPQGRAESQGCVALCSLRWSSQNPIFFCVPQVNIISLAFHRPPQLSVEICRVWAEIPVLRRKVLYPCQWLLSRVSYYVYYNDHLLLLISFRY